MSAPTHAYEHMLTFVHGAPSPSSILVVQSAFYGTAVLSGRPQKSIQSGIARRDLTIRGSLMGKGEDLLTLLQRFITV